MSVQIVIAAAGFGFTEQDPKVLRPFPEKPMLQVILETVVEAGFTKPIVIVNPVTGPRIMETIPKDGVTYVVQEERKGTAQALELCLPFLDAEHVVTVYADMPLWTSRTLQMLAEKHIASGAGMSLALVKLDESTPENVKRYGRIVRDGAMQVADVFEPDEYHKNGFDVKHVNPSLFAFRVGDLPEALASVTKLTAKGERSLCYTIHFFSEKVSIHDVLLDDPNEALGINTEDELAVALAIMRQR